MLSNEVLKTFNDLDMEMYNFTINKKQLVPYMTIREFAEGVHASPPSVLRYCKKIGFSGFVQYKEFCKKELEKSEEKVSNNEAGQIFRDFLILVQTPFFQEKLSMIAEILSKSKRIYCVGDGASGSIAYYSALYFTVSGKYASCIDGRLLKAIHQPSDDIYIIFSVSGETDKMISFIQKIKENHGTSIVITNSEYSTLSKMANYVLPYNIYNFKMNQDDEMIDRYDNLSTQLPAVYLIETLANRIIKK